MFYFIRDFIEYKVEDIESIDWLIPKCKLAAVQSRQFHKFFLQVNAQWFNLILITC